MSVVVWEVVVFVHMVVEVVVWEVVVCVKVVEVVLEGVAVCV